MLPPLDSEGNLPRGIHACRFAELIERFGKGSPEREVEIQELERFLAWANRAGIRRLIINGSFVTAKPAPNDVDVVILPGPRIGQRPISGLIERVGPREWLR